MRYRILQSYGVFSGFLRLVINYNSFYFWAVSLIGLSFVRWGHQINILVLIFIVNGHIDGIFIRSTDWRLLILTFFFRIFKGLFNWFDGDLLDFIVSVYLGLVFLEILPLLEELLYFGDLWDFCIELSAVLSFDWPSCKCWSEIVFDMTVFDGGGFSTVISHDSTRS